MIPKEPPPHRRGIGADRPLGGGSSSDSKDENDDGQGDLQRFLENDQNVVPEKKMAYIMMCAQTNIDGFSLVESSDGCDN